MAGVVMHAYEHAVNSAKRWGGRPEDYLPIHQWFDVSKHYYADVRHRALRHHTEGIAHCEEAFGVFIVPSGCQNRVYVKYIGEQHVKEDLGFIPSIQDWYSGIKLEKWMLGARTIKKEETWQNAAETPNTQSESGHSQQENDSQQP
jgi:hypothetical protein